MGIKEEEKQADARAQEILEECLPIKWDSKRYAVFSTRKNPDKLIESLKRQLEREREYGDGIRERWLKAQGASFTSCWPDSEHVMRCTNEEVAKMSLNQKVIIVGHLSSYKQVEGGHHRNYTNEVTISLTEVRLREKEQWD